jgi:hypothetical protein
LKSDAAQLNWQQKSDQNAVNAVRARMDQPRSIAGFFDSGDPSKSQAHFSGNWTKPRRMELPEGDIAILPQVTSSRSAHFSTFLFDVRRESMITDCLFGGLNERMPS